MGTMKIKIRKETIIKSLFIRVLLYAFLIITFVILLYPLMPYIEKHNIIYLPYFIILFIGVLVSQYFIYALSLNEKPSYNNFKNAILRISPRNPINFLFPEFESMYNLNENVEDRLDIEELNKIINNSIDDKKAIEIENEFKAYIKKNLNLLLEYDVVIKMKRKGKAIFDDLIDDFPELERLVPFTDSEVVLNASKIENRKILIFDDSIHTSDSARNIIDVIKEIGYKKILFVCVIAQDKSLDSLKKDYPENDKIFFLQYRKETEEDYQKFYAEYMFGYLDRVNSSLESDHTQVKLKIDSLIKIEDLIKLFDDKQNYVYEVHRIVNKENKYKISVECRWIYDELKYDYTKKIKMDMVKVRFFVKLISSNNVYPKGTTEISLSSVLIPRDFNTDFCTSSKPKVNKSCIINDISEQRKITDPNLKEFICISCLIWNLNDDFIESFMNYFKQQLEKECNAHIFENRKSYPLPTEIYPFEYIIPRRKKDSN